MTPPGPDSWPPFHQDGAVLQGRSGDHTASSGWRANLLLALQRLFVLVDQARSTKRVLLALFLASALLNVTIGMLFSYRKSPQALDWDEIEYWSIANGILAGHWDFGERRTLAFPLIIAGLRLLHDNFLFVQVGLSVIAGLAAPLLYCLVRRLGGSPARGLLAGIVMMLWPAQLFMATSLYSEAAALPCFLLVLIMLPPGSRTGVSNWTVRWQASGALLAGLALGVCAQIRPMYLLFLPIALVVPFLEERVWRVATRTALLLALGFAIMVLPWSVWMSSRHGELIILTANGGETLAGGLNPKLVAMAEVEMHLPKRGTWVGPGKWLPPQDTGFLSPAETQLPYPAMSRLLRERSVAWIIGNPGEAMRIELYKVAYMWGFYPWRGDELMKLLVGNVPILALLGVTLLAAARKSTPWLPLARLWTVPLFVTGIALISWGSWRFRQPADAALIALCVLTLGLASRRSVGQVAQ